MINRHSVCGQLVGSLAELPEIGSFVVIPVDFEAFTKDFYRRLWFLRIMMRSSMCVERLSFTSAVRLGVTFIKLILICFSFSYGLVSHNLSWRH